MEGVGLGEAGGRGEGSKFRLCVSFNKCCLTTKSKKKGRGIGMRWAGVESKFCLCVSFDKCCLGNLDIEKERWGGVGWGRSFILVFCLVNVF